MAPQVGFEPTTDRLTADSSTTELLRNNYYYFLNINSATVRQKPRAFVAKRIPCGTIRFSTTELLRKQFYMVGLNGLEPSTSRLSGVRSNQLSYRPIIFMERVKGIEPSSTAWKAVVLPLNYTRNIYTLIPVIGLELTLQKEYDFES